MPSELANPPPEVIAEYRAEEKRKKLSQEAAARTIFAINQELGIKSAPREIKARYPLLNKLEAAATKQQQELFEETKGVDN